MAATGGPFVRSGTGPERVLASPVIVELLVGAGVLVTVTVAVHYANEYADVDTDRLTDPTPFSGGSGAAVETGLPAAFFRRITVAAMVVAGVAIGVSFGTGVLSIEAAAILATVLAVGLGYSLPPVALIRRGVGEVANAALGGLLVPVYGVAVVSRPTRAAVLAVVPFALVVGCSLLSTHWPDRGADAAVGKRTLVVRWTRRRIRQVYGLVAVLAALAVAVLWTAGVVPDAVAVAHLVAVPFLLWGWTTLTRERSPLPAVAAMVALAAATTAAYWWVAVAPVV